MPGDKDLIAQNGAFLLHQTSFLGGLEQLVGIDRKGSQIKAKGQGARAPKVAGKAFAVGAVIPVDKPKLDQSGQMAPQRAFRHSVQPLAQCCVGREHNCFAWFCDQRTTGMKCHQSFENGEGPVVEIKRLSRQSEGIEKTPFIIGRTGYLPVLTRLNSLYWPPKLRLGRVLHEIITTDNKLSAPHACAELTELCWEGYLKGAKIEKGLLGTILGGFSFAVSFRASFLGVSTALVFRPFVLPAVVKVEKHAFGMLGEPLLEPFASACGDLEGHTLVVAFQLGQRSTVNTRDYL